MPIENPSLDLQTFEDLLNEAKKNLPIHSTVWTNYNESDPGITLLELFCWLADNQIYKLNRITKQNYLKFLRLLGEYPHRPLPAELNVSIPYTSKNATTLPKKTKLITDHDDLIFETRNDLELLPVTIKKVLTSSPRGFVDRTGLLLSPSRFIYGFGRIPKVGDSFLLGLDTDYNKEARLNIGIELEDTETAQKDKYEKTSTDNTTFYPSCKLEWMYLKSTENTDTDKWHQLVIDKDTTLSLTKSGIVSLIVPFDDVSKHDLDNSGIKLKWILCRLVDGLYDIPPRIRSIHTNTIPATQGWTVTETLGQSNGLPDQSFGIKNIPLIDIINVIIKNTESNVSTTWKQIDNLDSSGPDDKHYVVDFSDSAIGFGDGINGDIPSHHDVITVVYRYGAILKYVDLNSLQLFVADNEPSSSLPFTILFSGREPESIDEAILRVRHALKLPSKAVSVNDYEYIVKNTPGLNVSRISAIPDSNNNLVNVVVVPMSYIENPTPSPEFLRIIYEHLEKHRLLTTKINVIGPNYVKVSVSADVEIKTTMDPLEMKKQIIDALNKFLSPVSGASQSGWKFGQPVYKSEIYSIIKNIPGVKYMTQPYLQASGKQTTFRYGDGKLWIDKISLVYPGLHFINIRNISQDQTNGGYRRR